jgi:hypothetical protein
MIIKHLVSQEEYSAYIMQGTDYKRGHPTFWGCDPGGICYGNHPYLVLEHKEGHVIISSRFAGEYLLIDATEEEKNILMAEGYKMIGLG